MLTLGIESSCDDTGAAVLKDGKNLLSNIVTDQHEIHTPFGGVVPELASRQHLQTIKPIVDKALTEGHVTLQDIDLIAVTQGPGLIGSLLVGFCYAKSLSYISKIPIIGVDHMRGHLLSIFLEQDTPEFPYVALIASGGTTSIFRCQSVTDIQLLGRTRDDAAGEAFDKVAKLLQLGYPGGPLVSQWGADGNDSAFNFPRAWLEKGSFDFSFSGLKTAVLQQYRTFKKEKSPPKSDLCASFEKAVIEVLATKTIAAAKDQKVATIVLGGGVSANQRLRETMKEMCNRENLDLYIPQPQFCTDNGAMIAMAGYMHYTSAPHSLSLDSDVFSRSVLG